MRTLALMVTSALLFGCSPKTPEENACSNMMKFLENDLSKLGLPPNTESNLQGCLTSIADMRAAVGDDVAWNTFLSCSTGAASMDAVLDCQLQFTMAGAASSFAGIDPNNMPEPGGPTLGKSCLEDRNCDAGQACMSNTCRKP